MILSTRRLALVSWTRRRISGLLATALAIVLPVGPIVADADDWGRIAYSPAVSLEGQWRSVDDSLSPSEYDRATRQNRRILYGTIEETITSLGAPPEATRVVGGLVGLAVGDARVGLNRDDTLILRLNDVARSDRGVFLNVELAW